MRQKLSDCVVIRMLLSARRVPTSGKAAPFITNMSWNYAIPSVWLHLPIYSFLHLPTAGIPGRISVISIPLTYNDQRALVFVSFCLFLDYWVWITGWLSTIYREDRKIF